MYAVVQRECCGRWEVQLNELVIEFVGIGAFALVDNFVATLIVVLFATGVLFAHAHPE